MRECFAELEWRGLVHQTSDPMLAKLLDSDSLTFYVGFDPTADSLHVGNLVGLLTARRLAEAGHRPIVLVGGATGLIGDPGGRSAERPLLSREELARNVQAVGEQVRRLVGSGSGPEPELVDNTEWLQGLGLVDFLRQVGKQATVSQMLAKEAVRSRLEGRQEGISFAEFSYMLLQAYDYLHLYDTRRCRLQAGGSDQWGNITMGVELIRRMRGEQVFGLTWPLVLRADGTKFGKSEQGAVWLDPKRTSPYQLYQFFIRTEDAVVGRYLRYFTWLDRSSIEELEASVRRQPEQRQAQRELAWQVTALVHGPAEAARARRASEALFGEGLRGLDQASLLEVFGDAPSSQKPRSLLEGPGWPLVDALVDCGLERSKSAARRSIAEGAVSVNGCREPEVARTLSEADLLAGGLVVLTRGRKSHHLFRFA